MRRYGVYQEFRIVEGIWLYRKDRQLRFLFGNNLFYIIRAQHILNDHLIQVPWLELGSGSLKLYTNTFATKAFFVH